MDAILDENILKREEINEEAQLVEVFWEQFITLPDEQPKKVEKLERKICVGNLPITTQIEALKKFFKSFGEVEEASFCRETKKYKFATVTFKEMESAEKTVSLKYLRNIFGWIITRCIEVQHIK